MDGFDDWRFVSSGYEGRRIEEGLGDEKDRR
jgi:hypothetical protein